MRFPLRSAAIPAMILTALLTPGCSSDPVDPNSSKPRGYTYTVATYDAQGNKGTRDSIQEWEIIEDSISYKGKVGVRKLMPGMVNGSLSYSDRDIIYASGGGTREFSIWYRPPSQIFTELMPGFWATYPMDGAIGSTVQAFDKYEVVGNRVFQTYEMHIIGSITILGRENIQVGGKSLSTIKFVENALITGYSYVVNGVLHDTMTLPPRTLWYAPEIGYLARMEEEDTSGNKRVSILTSYRL